MVIELRSLIRKHKLDEIAAGIIGRGRQALDEGGRGDVGRMALAISGAASWSVHPVEWSYADAKELVSKLYE